ncbi:MAG: hypothetical protein AB3N16_09530, partial [Flavobacteriaceae bacterium]
LFVVLFMASLGHAQHCPANFSKEQLEELAHILEDNLPKMAVVRKWARENNRPDIEMATNRLEWFAKDRARYIRKHKDTDFEAVCNRMFHPTYREYLSDYMTLTIPMPYVKMYGFLDDITYTKYK